MFRVLQFARLLCAVSHSSLPAGGIEKRPNAPVRVRRLVRKESNSSQIGHHLEDLAVVREATLEALAVFMGDKRFQRIVGSRRHNQTSLAGHHHLITSVKYMAAGEQVQHALPHSNIESCSKDSQWELRTCRLRNLCIDTATRQFQWNGMGVTKMPSCEELFHLSAGGNDPCLRLHEVDSQQRVTRKTSIAFIKGKTALLASSVDPSNAGHFLIQTATALERLANDYSLPKVEDRIVVLDNDCKQWKNSGLCHKFTMQYASVLSDYAPIILSELNASVSPDNRFSKYGFVCFENAVGGIGRHNPFERDWANMSEWVAPYRAKLYTYYQLPVPQPKSTGCNVAFTWKDGMHGLHPIHNSEDLDNSLLRWTRSTRATYKGFSLSNVSLVTQLSTLGQTDILITVPGSTAFCALFMAPGTDVVYLDSPNYESRILSFSNEFNLSFVAQEGQDSATAKVKPEHLFQRLNQIKRKRHCNEHGLVTGLPMRLH